MGEILLLAFVAAVYPTLLAGVIVMLSRPAPRPLLAGFLLGGVIVSVTCGLVIVFALKGALSTPHQKSASPWVDLIAGVLSLILAGALWARRDRGRLGDRHASTLDRSGGEQASTGEAGAHESFSKRMLAHGSPKAAFTLGLILNLPGIWYLIALKDIAKDKYGPVDAVLLILIFNAIMFLLVEVPLIGYLFSPGGTRARVERFQRWLSANGRLVAATAALLIGAYLIVKAIVELS